MYISPIDLLDISIEELENIDNKNIIRLEKRLKILAKQDQNNVNNIEEVQLLINQLKDPIKRQTIIFIEEHPLFKQFITNGVANKPSVFNFKEKYTTQLSSFSSFLAPYLETYFIPLLKKDYQRKKYDTIIEALRKKDLFTDDLLFKAYQYIEQQTKILIETINITPKRKLYEKCPQVTYRTFIELLNTVPNGIIKDLKIDYVNALVDYYNKTLTNNSEYTKIKKAYRLFSEIETEDPFVHDQLKKLGLLGYKSELELEETNQTSGFLIIRVIAIIIAIAVAIAKCSNDSNKYNYTPNSQEVFNNSLKNENILKFIKKNAIQKQRTFLENLYIASKEAGTSTNKTLKKLTSGEDPFYTFNKPIPHLHKQLIVKSHYSDSILINNSSTKDLILFSKYQNEPLKSAIIVKQKDSLKIKYENLCYFTFYLGKNFMRSFDKNIKSSFFFNEITVKDSDRLLKKYTLSNKVNHLGEIKIQNDTILFKNVEVEISIDQELEKIQHKIKEEKEKLVQIKKRSSFFEKLKDNVNNSSLSKAASPFHTGDNPYPLLFESPHKEEGYEVSINNDSEKNLIIFTRNNNNYRNFASYIAPNDQLSIYFYENVDSIYLYRGTSFYLKNNINVLNMDSMDKLLFDKPIIIQNFLGQNPKITITNNNVSIEELDY